MNIALHSSCLANHEFQGIDAFSPPCFPAAAFQEPLPSLDTLVLSGNGITSIQALQLGRLTALTCLMLNSNDITVVNGLEGLKSLREIILDQNKIR